MINIKINGFVDKEISTVEEAIAKAIEKVEKIDRVNSYSKNVLTKLYFIAPKAGVIVVAISEDDKEILKVDSQVLAVTQISEYPLTKLPEQLLVYKEVIANKQSTFSFDDLMNAAQAVTDRSDENLNNKKITVTKVLDYRNDEPSTLVLNSAFGDNIFLSTDAVISNDGDADAGGDVLGGVVAFSDSTDPIFVDSEAVANCTKVEFELAGTFKDGSNQYIFQLGNVSDEYDAGDRSFYYYPENEKCFMQNNRQRKEILVDGNLIDDDCIIHRADKHQDKDTFVKYSFEFTNTFGELSPEYIVIGCYNSGASSYKLDNLQIRNIKFS